MKLTENYIFTKLQSPNSIKRSTEKGEKVKKRALKMTLPEFSRNLAE